MLGLMSDATCGEACWAAREDICRCSCSGRNHGVTRTTNGETPTRTRRVKAHRYQLLAVESYRPDEARIVTLRPIEKLQGAVNVAAYDAGLFNRHASRWDSEWWPSEPAWPCKVTTASHSAVKGWPELAAWRGARSRPLVAWVREDMAHLVSSP
jgi:hypothetical protein